MYVVDSCPYTNCIDHAKWEIQLRHMSQAHGLIYYYILPVKIFSFDLRTRVHARAKRAMHAPLIIPLMHILMYIMLCERQENHSIALSSFKVDPSHQS